MINRIRKLYSLSSEEIKYRIKEKLLIKYEELLNYFSIQPVFKPIKVEAQGPLFFFSEVQQEQRRQMIKKNLNIDKIMSEADGILKGKVNLLGHDIQIPNGKGWHKDPITNIFWPDIFFTKVRHHPSVKDCDIKYVWEINRHQFLIPMAKAYWLTQNEKYAEKVFEIISDWIDNTTYNKGVNWISALEHSVRLFSWVWSISFCQHSNCYNKYIDQIKRSIYQQTTYIYNHLSTYSSPYNHLIGEAAALHLVGVLFPDFDHSDKWEKAGIDILEKTVGRQFHSDGITVEQAFFYHHFTLGFYLQTIFLRKFNQRPVSSHMKQIIEKAVESSVFLTMPNNEIPMVGDIDSARSIYFTNKHSWDFTGFHQLGAVLFSRGDFKITKPQKLSEELLWIVTDEDLAAFESLKVKSPTTHIFLEKSGYIIARDSWKKSSNYMCFDCGQIADGLSSKAVPSAAHGHLDALSIIICANGESFLIDSGFYTYFGDLDWHKVFRQEQTHNTLKIEGKSQAEYCGRLKWQNVVTPKIKDVKENEDHLFCSGFISYPHGPIHTRKIYYRKRKFWTVQDIVSGGQTGISCENNFNFDPGATLKLDRKTGGLEAMKQDVRLLIIPVGEGMFTIQQGGRLPSEGWACKGYGIKDPAYRAVFHWDLKKGFDSRKFIILPLTVNENVSQIFYDAGNDVLKIKDEPFSTNLNTLNLLNGDIERSCVGEKSKNC